MLNQPWWTHLAIFNMSHWKRIWTFKESFLAPNWSQSESEKNDTEEEQCINQEEWMRIEGNRKNHTLSRKLGCEITHGCAMKKRRCSAIFVGNPFALTEGCTNFRTSTLQRHKHCKEHEDVVNEEAMRDLFSNTKNQEKKVLTPIKLNFSCLYHFSCVARIRLKKRFLLACLYECNKKNVE